MFLSGSRQMQKTQTAFTSRLVYLGAQVKSLIQIDIYTTFIAQPSPSARPSICYSFHEGLFE